MKHRQVYSPSSKRMKEASKQYSSFLLMTLSISHPILLGENEEETAWHLYEPARPSSSLDNLLQMSGRHLRDSHSIHGKDGNTCLSARTAKNKVWKMIQQGSRSQVSRRRLFSSCCAYNATSNGSATGWQWRSIRLQRRWTKVETSHLR